MFRLLFTAFCSLSLLLCTAAGALTIHSHRTPHRVVWRADVGEGVRSSLAAIWREYRGRGGANGSNSANGGNAGEIGGADSLFLTLKSLPPQEHRSLSLANGKLEYQRHSVPGPFC